jgi:hypothetical protein
MDKNIQKFSIWTNIYGSKYNSSSFKDTSILQNFDYIYNLSRNINNNIQRNLILHHPKLKMIQINNKQEWDFLYENNIINECIENILINKEKNIYRKILKINYANKDSQNKTTKYSDIVEYIINNFSFETYMTHLFNFLNIRKEILVEFKFYLINVLLKLNEYKTKEEKKEETGLNNEIVENKEIFETKNLLQNIENKFKDMKNIYNVNSDIYFDKIYEKSEYKINNTMKPSYMNNKEIDYSSKSVFNTYKSSLDYYKGDIKNGKLFEIQNRENYYNGIEGFNDEIKRLLKIC